MDTIVALLKQNARLSYKELAAMAGITEKEAEAKVREYEKNGVIKGYSAIINDELADKDSVTAFIEVKVTPKAGYGFDEIANAIMQYDEVEGLTLMSGAFDLAVTISGTNYKEIALFVAQTLSTIDGIIETTTHFVLRRYKEKGVFMLDDERDERGLVSP